MSYHFDKDYLFINIRINYLYKNNIFPTLHKLIKAYILHHQEKEDIYLNPHINLDTLLNKIHKMYKVNQELDLLQTTIKIMEEKFE